MATVYDAMDVSDVSGTSTATVVVIIIVVILVVVAVVLLVVWLTNRGKGIGSSCSVTSDCDSNLICDSPSGTCRVPVGGACSNNSDCITGDVCINNRCMSEVNVQPVM